MDSRTVPKISKSTDFGTWNGFLVRDSPVRYVVRIFGADLNRYGNWYGIGYGPESGTVCGTEFGTKKTVLAFCFGTVRGTDQNF